MVLRIHCCGKVIRKEIVFLVERCGTDLDHNMWWKLKRREREVLDLGLKSVFGCYRSLLLNACVISLQTLKGDQGRQ